MHPKAHLVLMNGYGWDRNEPANYTQEVLDRFDDRRTSRLVFPWLFNEWHGCEYDHAGMARYLAEHLAGVQPEWKAVRVSDVMDGFGRNGDVANGSFELVAPFGGFGWRYFEDGAVRVHAPGSCPDGEWFKCSARNTVEICQRRVCSHAINPQTDRGFPTIGRSV